jgi:hypothetical protein
MAVAAGNAAPPRLQYAWRGAPICRGDAPKAAEFATTGRAHTARNLPITDTTDETVDNSGAAVAQKFYMRR